MEKEQVGRKKEYGQADLYIDRVEVLDNKRIIDQRLLHKVEIENVFVGPLSWERLNSQRACRIKHVI